jgi:cell filamentation protein
MCAYHVRRYTTPKGSQSQYQPGSHERVLKNLQGIRRKNQMDQAEYAALLKAQTAWLDRIGPDTRFTAATLCRMHRDWLEPLYDWAGQYRSVELTKGDFRWPPAFRVTANMNVFERGLLKQHTPCPLGPIVEVAGRIAAVHAELLLIHPFREGNGRMARWLADLMAYQAGLPAPLYGFVGRGAKAHREQYLRAVQNGYVGNYADLAAFFAEALDRRRGRLV